jgi:Asp-tRNA(Asn)/Glu-tRNA(Gln) amidotransferase A subunit family amidase
MTEMSRRDFIQRTGVVRGISQVSGLLRFRADLLAKGCPWVFRSWGRRYADATVVRAAAALEDARPWNEKRPPL